ncbi:MAG: hypothetical protein N2C14_02805, partial [Planctomycetales bacterium]
QPKPGQCTARDDEPTKQIRNYFLRERSPGVHKKNLHKDHPGLYHAHQLMVDNSLRKTRNGIEARILAGQNDQEIAKVVGVTPETVHWYEACYFDVRGRLRHKDWVVSCVIGPIDQNMGPDSEDKLLKLFGYFAGSKAVDFIAWGGFKGGIPKIASEEELSAWMDANWAETLKMRSAMAAKTFEVNKYNVFELMMTHARIKEIEKSDDTVLGKQTRQEANIAAMLQELPWAVGGKPHEDYREVLLDFDQADAELNDQELLRVAAGEITPEMEAKKLTKMPPPRRKANGEPFDETNPRKP